MLKKEIFAKAKHTLDEEDLFFIFLENKKISIFYFFKQKAYSYEV